MTLAQSDALTIRLNLLNIGAFQIFYGSLGIFWVLVGAFEDFLSVLKTFAYILDR